MAKRNTRKNADIAVQVAKGMRGNISHDPVRLSSGYWAIVSPVSAPLIDEAASRVVGPDIPMVYIEEKDRSEPNPNDPVYLEQLDRIEVDRSLASIDVIIMMGVEIINEDGTEFVLDKEEKWFRKLELMAKMNLMDLDVYDMDDPDVADFVFKKYIAVATADIAMLTSISGLNAEEIDQAVKTFRSD
jgi:hypothetical protein